MLRPLRMRLLALSLPLVVFAGDAGFGASRQPGHGGEPPRAVVAAALQQVQFVPNLGQWDAEVRYAAFGDTLGWLHDDGFTLRLERWTPPASDAVRGPREQTGCVVRTRFLGAQVPTFTGQTELATRRHFFCGDRARWRADVPSQAQVTMAQVHPGIDVVYRSLPAGQRGPFEYDLVLAPHADLSRFVARCEGVEQLRIDATGRLRARLQGPDGEHELVQEAPVAWQETPTGRRPLAVSFRLLDEVTYGFVAHGLDPACVAVVDPGVVWGTFLGGGLTDSVNALRWREGVGVWVAGWASSTDFPTTPGAYRTTGGADGFVARLGDDGTTLQFATYLGGVRAEEVRGLDLGPGDTPTVVGYTQSADFPVTAGALQPTYRGGSLFLDVGDGFVTRLAATGNALLASTFLGGVFDDVAEAVSVDGAGAAIVAGWTSSPDFPSTPGAYQGAIAGVPGAQSDGFVAKVAANGQSLGYATFVGGSLNDQFVALDRDPVTGDALAAGWTLSVDYPTTAGAARPNFSGLVDGVVTRLAASGASLGFSTYLGGLESDYALCVTRAPDGTVWVGGTTNSANFPLSANALQGTPGGEKDGFVTQLPANGTALQYSTRLGGPGPDRVRALDVATLGVVAVGEAGVGFPLTLDAEQPVFGGGVLDAFLCHLTNGGTTLAYSTYLGGANQDALGCAVLSDGGVVVVGGWSFSADFPVAPAGYQPLLRGVEDGVVLKFDLVTTFGDGLAVTGEAVGAPTVVPPGAHELLGATLQNLTARELAVDSVRLLIAGAGQAPARVAALRVLREADGQPPVVVGGPVPVPVDDAEFAVALTGCLVPASGSIRVRVVADLVADPTGAASEFAVAVAGPDAWTLRALGAGGGPSVQVAAPGRASGQVLVLGALPGDADGDGQRTVVDVRRQIAWLGSSQPAIDCDGDGQLSTVDLVATREAVLGRATGFAAPAAVARGAWMTLRGCFPSNSLQASLGGRVLTIGTVTPREMTVLVAPDQLTGTQELVLSSAGRVVLNALVAVQ